MRDVVGDEASLPRRALPQARAFTVRTSSLWRVGTSVLRVALPQEGVVELVVSAC